MNVYGNGEEIDQLEQASSSEEKISPNTSFILKKTYTDCGHTVKDFVELPQELVNMTETELKQKYPDFQVEVFSSKEIILSKKETGICNEHYLLKEREHHIAIYTIDKDGKEKLLEDTSISTQYLPETDAIAIQNGIKLYGKEALNSALEDYE